MKDSGRIRFLDRYAGSFLCCIFSGIHRLKPKRDKKRPVRNILFIELFEMGATIMAYPSINYIKQALPDANIFSLCTDKVKESWELVEAIPGKNIFSINDKNLFTFVLSLFKHIFSLWRKDINLIIDFELFMRISAVISFLIKTDKRAGFYRYMAEGLFRGTFYDCRCCFNQNYHISKNFLALAKTALSSSGEYPNYKGRINKDELTPPAYKTHPALRAGLIKKIRSAFPGYSGNKLILFVPDVGSILPVRNYPADMCTKTIKMLLSSLPGYLLLLVGVPENRKVCSFIHSSVSSRRCINFCGKTDSITELTELINMSELLIGMDNGPIHFASATPAKIIALFSTDSPFVYGPLGRCVIIYNFYQCSPCISAFNHKRSGCTNNLCLQSVRPETVFDYSVRILNNELDYRTINNKIPYL